MSSPRLAIRGVFYRDGKILLIQLRNNEREWYLIPGGGVDHGETLEQAFHREMAEEIGYRCSMGDVVLIREVMNPNNDHPLLPNQFHQVEVYVKAELVKPLTSAHNMDTHQIASVWMPVEQLRHIEFYPGELVEQFVHQDWSTIYQGPRM